VEVRCAPPTYEAAVRDIGPGAAAWAIETATHAVDSARAIGPGTPEGLRILVAATQACVLAVVRGLAADVPATGLDPPAELLGSVRGAVRGGVEVSRLLRMMWTSHLATVDRLAATLDSAEEVRGVTTDSFGYVEWFSDVVERRYAAELSEWTGSAAAARLRVVERLVAREEQDLGAAEVVLGHTLTGWHGAVLLTADETPEALDGVLLRLGRTLAADGTLVLPRGTASLWAWLHWPVRPARRPVSGPLPPGVRVTLGPVLEGVAGFRWTHLAAREADRLPGAEIVEYADVAVPALLTANGEHAAHFALAVLGPALCAGDRRARTLRETLAAYLAHGRSPTSAGERLHVAAGTVAYRVKQAETLLEEPLEGAAGAVMTALEVMRAFDAVGLAPAAFVDTGPLRPH